LGLKAFESIRSREACRIAAAVTSAFHLNLRDNQIGDDASSFLARSSLWSLFIGALEASGLCGQASGLCGHAKPLVFVRRHLALLVLYHNLLV
jgi:hypothetical protein